MKWSSPLPRLVFSSSRNLLEPGFGFYLCHDDVGFQGLTLYIYLGTLVLFLGLTWPATSTS